MKQVIYCLIFIFCSLMGNAQDTLSIKVIDQYQRDVEGAKLTVDTLDDTNLMTNSSGQASLVYINSDSVSIFKDGYIDKTISIESIKNIGEVTIKKAFSYRDLITPMFYIINGGLWLLLLIIFAETGLFIGFFFPGDSLLFVAGIYSKELMAKFSTGNAFIDMLVLTLMIIVAGVLGNSLGYYFGKKIGAAMFSWQDRFLFRKKYLIQAHSFYESNGGAAIIYARFVPIVRTFAPIVAGIVAMDKKKFTFYNIVGCILWVPTMIFAGHYLQRLFEVKYNFNLKKHLEIIVLGIALITTLPIIIKVFFGKKKSV